MYYFETTNQLFDLGSSDIFEHKADMCTIVPDQLIDLYNRKKNSFCGIGIRTCKYLLNSLMAKGSKEAALYKALLDTECSYVYMFKYVGCARNYAIHYADNYYLKVQELLDVCSSYQIERGYIEADSYGMNSVVFMNVPEVGQVSYHTWLNSEIKKQLYIYKKEWDGNADGIYNKLETAILKTFSDEINSKRIMKAIVRQKVNTCISEGWSALCMSNRPAERETIKVLADGKQISIQELCLRITKDTSLVATPVTIQCRQLYDGLIFVNVKAPCEWEEKKCDNVMSAVHHAMLKNNSYMMTTTAGDGRSFNVLAYVQPLFYTKREHYSNAAPIYSQVITALSDYLNESTESVIANYIENMNAIHEIQICCSYGLTLVNGDFHARKNERREFNDDAEYSNYTLNRNFVLPVVNKVWEDRLAKSQSNIVHEHEDIDQWIDTAYKNSINHSHPNEQSNINHRHKGANCLLDEVLESTPLLSSYDEQKMVVCTYSYRYHSKNRQQRLKFTRKLHPRLQKQIIYAETPHMGNVQPAIYHPP